MKNLEINKMLGAFLLVAFVITFSHNFIDIFYETVTSEERKDKIEVVEQVAESGGQEQKSAQDKVFDVVALLASADAEAGKKVSGKCTACHSFDKGGPDKVGPNLYGIIGSNVAHSESFAAKYSPAMKGKGGVWGYQELFQYLNNPKKYIPGNRMAYGGVKDEKELANLIAYLRTMNDNPPPYN